MLVLFGFIQKGTQTGGQVFEVDATDSSIFYLRWSF